VTREQTDLYIRQLADGVIQQCDTDESARIAAARAAKAAAAAKAKLLKECLASGGTGLVLEGDGRTYTCAYPIKSN
jgi:hypothetical protein